MTPQEAIEFINARKISIQKWSNNEQLAINMAIESLEKQRHCEECECDIYKTICRGCKECDAE